MKTITWKLIEERAKPGEKLLGNYTIKNWQTDEIIHKKELVFLDCIGCLTSKDDVRNNTTHYVDLDGNIFEVVE